MDCRYKVVIAKATRFDHTTPVKASWSASSPLFFPLDWVERRRRYAGTERTGCDDAATVEVEVLRIRPFASPRVTWRPLYALPKAKRNRVFLDFKL
jgi:hypothetical protein